VQAERATAGRDKEKEKKFSGLRSVPEGNRGAEGKEEDTDSLPPAVS
jgi:hypothetical protein